MTRQYITWTREQDSEDENGEDTSAEITTRFPAKFEVCHRCGGTGTHVNPNVDGHGITAEEFSEDPDFKEAYFGGVYDVRCEDCKGERVVLEIDEQACERAGLGALLKEYLDDQAEAARYEAEDRYTRRMENGGFD